MVVQRANEERHANKELGLYVAETANEKCMRTTVNSFLLQRLRKKKNTLKLIEQFLDLYLGWALLLF